MNRRNFLRKTATVAIIAPVIAVTKIAVAEKAKYCVIKKEGYAIDVDSMRRHGMSPEEILELRRSGKDHLIPMKVTPIETNVMEIVEIDSCPKDKKVYFQGTYEECFDWRRLQILNYEDFVQVYHNRNPRKLFGSS